jgi:hypothetical protein
LRVVTNAGLGALSNNPTLAIVYVVSSFVPVKLFGLPSYTNAHRVVVKAGRLGKVANIEFYSFIGRLVLLSVTYTEIKPLMVARRIGVNAHKQIVLKLPRLEHHVQITGLEV